MRLIVILLTLFILFQALPVHFFTDDAEWLLAAKYYCSRPLEIFSPLRSAELYTNHTSFSYRIGSRIFWTVCYALTGVNPVSYNILDGILFLFLILSIYQITYLLSNSPAASSLACLFFLLTPSNYKLVQWLGITSSLPLLNFALYFLFKLIKEHKPGNLFAALPMVLIALASDCLNIFLIPALFIVFFLLYKKEYAGSKNVFIITLGFILFFSGIAAIFSIIALKDVPRLNPIYCFLYRINPACFSQHSGYYYGVFQKNGIPYLFLVGFLRCLFRPRRVYFFALAYSLSGIAFFLFINVMSPRYFAWASVGLSMFLGLAISDILKDIKYRKWNLAWTILLAAGILLSAHQIKENIGRMNYAFSLARQSYAHQKEEMGRLSSLPRNAVIYADNKWPAHFYGLMLEVINRKDVSVQYPASRDAVDRNLFFEGETKPTKNGPYDTLTDRLGDWRL
jgi:hypothetical protein